MPGAEPLHHRPNGEALSLPPSTCLKTVPSHHAIISYNCSQMTTPPQLGPPYWPRQLARGLAPLWRAHNGPPHPLCLCLLQILNLSPETHYGPSGQRPSMGLQAEPVPGCSSILCLPFTCHCFSSYLPPEGNNPRSHQASLCQGSGQTDAMVSTPGFAHQRGHGELGTWGWAGITGSWEMEKWGVKEPPCTV